jgi:S-adenosylmethionine-diacylglycerol 3-amino-3-carboxypropyl transferase
LPVAFAQVREDAQQDLQLVNSFRRKIDVLMVASGGCTAALLAASPYIRSLRLVDPNPSQLALARLKLYLLRTASRSRRLKILGHAPWPSSKRRQALQHSFDRLKLDSDVLGPIDLASRLGPDHCGRYEMLFERLRFELRGERPALLRLLSARDIKRQATMVDPRTQLGKALNRAFRRVMSLPNLVALFGPEATANSVQPFFKHFLERTRVIC